MAIQKPSVPKGTRDFSPEEMVRRTYIFETIKSVFKEFGFLPIETPAMENLSTLLGKYGEEGDKLLFRILNSGDFLSGVEEELIENKNSSALASVICDRGLRYDLTVPFARYVVQHRNEINFPFKRYQIQPVWRADRPQKGRYREFYQCDVDIIGSDSLINETEFIAIIDKVFNALNLPVIIKINNRKVLSGIAKRLDAEDKLTSLTVAIDKYEKIGKEKVYDELKDKGFTEEQLDLLDPFFGMEGNKDEKLGFLEDFLKGIPQGEEGIRELKESFDLIDTLEIKNEVELDISLARGLNYYTGAIIEVKARDVKIGSICGGGRYDDLTGIFGLPGVSGVGISFGADRIYDVLLQTNAFPESTTEGVKVLFVNFGSKEARYILPLLMKLRNAGINSEIYPDAVKMKKQMSYANSANIPFVALVGENEIEKGIISLKNMKSGEQFSLSPDELIAKLNSGY